MGSLQEFAEATRPGTTCYVCSLPAETRSQLDEARRSYDTAGRGSYKRDAHVSVPAMVRWLESEGVPVTVAALNYHFARGHHRL